MATVAEIQRAIEELSEADYARLVEWFRGRDDRAWEAWDREIEEDAKAGRLSFLDERAAAAKQDGTIRDL